MQLWIAAPRHSASVFFCSGWRPGPVKGSCLGRRACHRGCPGPGQAWTGSRRALGCRCQPDRAVAARPAGPGRGCLALQELHDLVLADVHERFPSRRWNGRNVAGSQPAASPLPPVQANSACWAAWAHGAARLFGVLVTYGLAHLLVPGEVLAAQADRFFRGGRPFLVRDDLVPGPWSLRRPCTAPRCTAALTVANSAP